MTELKCIVFDIDDTLYLERNYVRSGFRAVGEWARRNLGIGDFAGLAWRAFEHGVRHSTFDLVLQECGVDPTPELIGQMVEVYRTHEPEIALAADARDCLEGLRGRLALATVTDGPLRSQRAKALALGLAAWMDPIVFTTELGPEFGKPHSRGFELVQEATGCSGPECVYVADNPAKDFVGPKSLEWATVRVRRPQGLHVEVEGGRDVDVEVPDLSGSEALFEEVSARPASLRHSP